MGGGAGRVDFSWHIDPVIALFPLNSFELFLVGI